jgi:hypothetical protein
MMLTKILRVLIELPLLLAEYEAMHVPDSSAQNSLLWPAARLKTSRRSDRGDDPGYRDRLGKIKMQVFVVSYQTCIADAIR